MRVDDNEIRNSVNPKQSSIGRLEWLGIIALGVMLGGLLHDGARVLIANAQIKYELERLKSQAEKAKKQRQHELAQNRAITQQNAIDAEIRRQLNSNQCQFWLQQNRLNPGTQKVMEGIQTYCPK